MIVFRYIIGFNIWYILYWEGNDCSWIIGDFMDNYEIAIDRNVSKKIYDFTEENKSFMYLNTSLFENIDKYKEQINIDFSDYYIACIKNLPKLSFDNVVNISKEVYKLYDKEKEFDEILNKMLTDKKIFTGTLDKTKSNCITNSNQSKIFLSGTYYDVILLCHEIGHYLKKSNEVNSSVFNELFFEVPSVTLELAADKLLKDKYKVKIDADKIRMMHIFSIKREPSIERDMFLNVMEALKPSEKHYKKDYIPTLVSGRLFQRLNKNPYFTEYLKKDNFSLGKCISEQISEYDYDIAYILGKYIINSKIKNELLDSILRYMDTNVTNIFSLDSEIIKNSLKKENLSLQDIDYLLKNKIDEEDLNYKYY